MYEGQLAASVPALVADAKASQASVKVASKNVGHFGSFDALRKTVLDVRGQLGEDMPVVVALAGVNEDGKPMVAVATNDAARKQGIKAGDLVRGASKILGGGGAASPTSLRVRLRCHQDRRRARGSGRSGHEGLNLRAWYGLELTWVMPGSGLHCPTPSSLARPAGNIQVYGDSFRALDEAIDVIEDESVVVVVGLPLLLNGEAGKSAQKARRWAANLEKRMRAAAQDESEPLNVIPTIELVDERLTTVTAHQQLFDAQIGGRRHRPMVDQQSAVVILQTALDRAERYRGAIDG